MRAVRLYEPGGPEKLVYEEVPDPSPRADECVVRVHASSVCGRDLIDRSGGVRIKRFPTILGHEFAGVVVDLGPVARAESDLRPGDRVVNLHRPSCTTCNTCRSKVPMLCERAWQAFGHTVDGAYAELVAAHHNVLVRLPEPLAFEPASTLMCTAGVALQALRGRGRVAPGERVLITGASGGVGGAAVQLARHLGAEVVAVTSSPAKVDRIRALGASQVVVAGEGRFHEEVKDLTRGGVDAVIECTGPATFDSSIRSLRKGGRVVVVGNIDKVKVELNLGALIMYGLELIGSASCTRQDMLDVLEVVKEGGMTAPIDRTLPLSEVATAHRLLAERAVVGRVVLLP